MRRALVEVALWLCIIIPIAAALVLAWWLRGGSP